MENCLVETNTEFDLKQALEKINFLEKENANLRVTIGAEQIASQSLINAIPDTILIISGEGKYIDMLCGNEKILVKPFNELLGKNIADFLTAELAERCLVVIDNALKFNDLQYLQYSVEIDNQLVFFEARIAPVYHNQVLFIIRDITDTVNRRNEIQEKEDWFSTIFNVARDGMAVEMNEKIIYVNDAFVKLYGFSDRQELIGKNISIIQSEESDAMMREFGELRLLGEPAPGVYEAVGRCKDGSKIDIEVTASAFEMNHQKYIVDVNRNISERKTFERQLKEQNEELQKINAELDRFVYSASHDLRAPLRSMLGLLQLFRIDAEEEKKEQYLKRMEKSINNLDKFVQDIINYSRNSRMELEIMPINLFDLINEIIEDIRYENPKTIPIYANYSKDFVLSTDQKRVAIILSNLLSNALRYHHADIDNAFVKITAQDIDNQSVITIEDNGIGIGVEHLDKIFNMFYRAHDKKVGTGLGLYIVKETVRTLKGKIEVESKIGIGTKFTLFIPCN
ncbi:MAG: sensor histidine kinase [Cytophagales bacterium]